jgi:multiple sugar transport system permease protein
MARRRPRRARRSAAALVSVAPLVVVAFVLESYLSRGNLAGAVR